MKNCKRLVLASLAMTAFTLAFVAEARAGTSTDLSG